MSPKQTASIVAALLIAGVTACSRSVTEVPAEVRAKVRETDVQSPYDEPTSRSDTSPRTMGYVVRTRDELSLAETASLALGRIGEPAVPSLAQSLQNSEPAIRRRAALTLARIGPAASGAVPDLVRALSDEDPQVAKAAARALGQIGPVAGDAVPALLRIMLESEE